MRYFIVKYLKRAVKRAGQTEWQMDEEVAVSNKIKTRDLQSANVILDFRDLRVIQAHMDGQIIPKDWDQVVSYYYKHYAKLIEQMFDANGHPIEITADPPPQPDPIP